MDWDFKSSTWDFGEMGREEDGFVDDGSSRLGVQENASVFSVDLKLGDSMKKLQESKGSSSSSGSSKRACVVNGAQSGSCLVEGCTADLSDCREYYRRHRVCERHSKTPTVTVRGKQQRFCQQCSRFQSLEEFDEEKRSCRKRLDGHNRRRRKPQRRPFQMTASSFLSNHQGYALSQVHQGVYDGHGLNASNGATLLHFSGSPSYTASAAGAVPPWPVKQEHDLHFTNQQQTVIPNSSADREKTFPFLLPNDTGRSNQTVPDRLDHDHKLFSSEPTDSVVNSNRALSLLSTRVISPDRTMDGGVQFDDGTVQRSHSSIPYGEVFNVAPDDMLENGASHVLPFSWK